MKEPPITALAATRPELTWRECAFSEAASAWREAGTATVAKTATAAVMALTRKEFFMDECPEAKRKMRLNMEKSVSKPAPAPRNGLPCAAKNGAAGPQGLISAPRMPARALPVKPKEPPKGNHRREVARRKDFWRLFWLDRQGSRRHPWRRNEPLGARRAVLGRAWESVSRRWGWLAD